MSKKEDANANKKDRKNPKNILAKPAVPFTPINIEKEKKEGGQDTNNEPSEDRKNKFNQWLSRKKNQRVALIWLNFIMLVAFIFSSWYQGCQTMKSLELTRESINDSRISDSKNRALTEKSIAIAKESADSSYLASQKALTLADNSFMETKKSNEISQNLMRDNLRAYVVISGFTNNIYKTGKIFTIKVNIINKGLTPAKNIEVFIGHSICLSNKNIGEKFKDIVEGLKSTTKKNVMLGPDVPNERQIYETLVTKKDSVNWANNICDLILLVGIQYYDIFGDVHHTIGCYNYDIITGEYYVNTFGNYNLVD